MVHDTVYGALRLLASKDKHGDELGNFGEIQRRCLPRCNMCRVSKLIRGMENYHSD